MSQRRYKRRKNLDRKVDPELVFALEANFRMHETQTTPEQRKAYEDYWLFLFGVYGSLVGAGEDPALVNRWVKTVVRNRLESGQIPEADLAAPIQYARDFLAASPRKTKLFVDFILTDEQGASIMTMEDIQELKKKWAGFKV